MKDFSTNVKVRKIIKKALENKVIFLEEINDSLQNDFSSYKIEILIDGLVNQGIKVVNQIDFFENKIKKYEILILNHRSMKKKYEEKIKKLDNNIEHNMLDINKLKNKISAIKRDKISNYLDILYVGLKLKTQTGRPFEIINVYDNLIIKNSKGREYRMNEEILKDYILKKDFNNSRRHYSYEPSIAKYVSEQLNKN